MVDTDIDNIEKTSGPLLDLVVIAGGLVVFDQVCCTLRGLVKKTTFFGNFSQIAGPPPYLILVTNAANGVCGNFFQVSLVRGIF